MATVTFFGLRAQSNGEAGIFRDEAEDPVTPVGQNFPMAVTGCPAFAEHRCCGMYAGSRDQAASAALAFSAIAWNAAGSLMAGSESTLRSTVMPDFDRPLMNTL